jgi:pimeloyl-ACP methyl ester carboxylesterase
VLFLAGACDVLVGPEFQEYQMSLFNEAEIIIIEDTGHFMFSEKPKESVKEVRGFLSNK